MHVELWVIFLEIRQFRHIIVGDITRVGADGKILLAVQDVILVVILRAVEGLERGNLSYDRLRERLCRSQLLDIGLGGAAGCSVDSRLGTRKRGC